MHEAKPHERLQDFSLKSYPIDPVNPVKRVLFLGTI